MTDSKNKPDKPVKPKKRGPEPERLKITGDPGEALDKLLRYDPATRKRRPKGEPKPKD